MDNRLGHHPLVTWLVRRPWLLPVMLALAVHSLVLWGGWVYDDAALVASQSKLEAPGFFSQSCTQDYGALFKRKPEGSYRPLFGLLVYALYQAGGLQPWLFHFVSLAVFCVATVWVVRVAGQVAPRAGPWLAIAAGVLYAVHPARVEVVALFTSLPDLLVELAALVLLGQWLAPPAGRKLWPAVGLAFGVTLTAVLAKESALFILGALAGTGMAWALLMPGATRRPAAALAVGVLAALGTALAARFLAGITSPISLVATLGRLVSDQAYPALVNLAGAVWEMVAPGPVVFWRQVPGGSAPAAVAAFLLLLAGLALAWWWALCRRSLALMMLCAWVGADVIQLGIITAGGYPYSQRYVAVAALVLLMCVAAWKLGAVAPAGRALTAGALRRPAWWVVALLVAYMAEMAFFSIQGGWACLSPQRFFTAMQAANPQAIIPLAALAKVRNQAGAPVAEVEGYVLRATALDPAHRQTPLLHNLLIKRFLAEGQYAEARDRADRALRLYPQDSDKQALLAVALAGCGAKEQALAIVTNLAAVFPAHAGYQRLARDMAAGRTPQPAVSGE